MNNTVRIDGKKWAGYANGGPWDGKWIVHWSDRKTVESLDIPFSLPKFWENPSDLSLQTKPGEYRWSFGRWDWVSSNSLIRAPWTVEQVDALNNFQRRGDVHPFTCPGHDGGGNRDLVATSRGWICCHCDYTQDWAHAMMFNLP